MKNQWSDNLRMRMEEHQESSPEGLWEDIEQIILKERSTKPVAASRRIRLWSARVGVAAAVVIIALVIVYHIPGQKGEDGPLGAEISEALSSPAMETFTPRKNDLIAKNIEPSPAQNRKTATPNAISLTDTTAHTENEEAKSIKDETGDDPSKAAQGPQQVEHKNLYAQSGQRRASDNSSNPYGSKQKGKPARLAANLYASNLSLPSKDRHTGYGSLGAGKMHIDSDDDAVEVYQEIIEGNQYKEVYTDIKHRQPVTMGVSLSHDLNRRWSITTGLTYSILSSELRAGSDSHYYSSKQVLHNVGIP